LLKGPGKKSKNGATESAPDTTGQDDSTGRETADESTDGRETVSPVSPAPSAPPRDLLSDSEADQQNIDGEQPRRASNSKMADETARTDSEQSQNPDVESPNHLVSVN